MAVEHALGIARRAARVAQRRGGVLVEHRPFEAVVGLGQLLVAQQVRDASLLRHVRAVAHQHERAHRRELCGDLFDERQEVQVEEEDTVLRVRGDPHQLVGVQPRIERVQHAARPGDRVIQLHVPVAIPGQRGHRRAGRHVERAQRVGQAARARRQVAKGIAVNVAFDAARHDLLIAVVPLGMAQQRRDQQWLMHHQSVHGGFLSMVVSARAAAHMKRSTDQPGALANGQEQCSARSACTMQRSLAVILFHVDINEKLV
ncbi:hypothetical protein D9M68_353840 [compost metagenome]